MVFFKNLSMRTQLLIMPVCAVVIFTMILFLLNSNIERIILDENNQYTDDTFSQISHNIYSSCDIYNRILTSLAYNADVQGYVTDTDMESKQEDFARVDKFIINTVGIKDGIEDVVLLSNSSKSYSLQGDADQLEGILSSLPENSVNYYTKVYNLNTGRYRGYYFIVATTIYSIDPNKAIHEKIGTAALVIDAGQLGLGMEDKAGSSIARFYLCDRAGMVYSGSDPGLAGSKPAFLRAAGGDTLKYDKVSIDKKEYFIKSNELSNTGGRIVCLVPVNGLFSDLVAARKLTYTFLGVAIVLILIPFLILIRNISAPLKKLTDFINSIKSGKLKQLKKEIHLEGYSEIRLMSMEFNSMLKEIDRLTHSLIATSSQLYEAEIEKKKSELSYLRSQINPHFLYNTLESIRGVAVIEKAERTMVMTGALASMFRYCVTGEDVVKLREEVEITKSYVQIQLIRFSNRFTVSYDFDEEALASHIPKMLLQPILENAFRHGLEALDGNGRLLIGGRIENGGVLKIWVKDNGVGIEKARLEMLEEQLKGEAGGNNANSGSGGSIGITNVNNRIRLIYGEGFGMSIDSRPGEGTEVILKIPSGRKIDV